MSVVQDLISRNRDGETVGLPCFCTANEHVLRAILKSAKTSGHLTVIEATCNQVNQDGGYTGMRPADFMAWIADMAAEFGVPQSQLILGGDHLGPNPWRKEPAALAMEKARVLVKDYVSAGFTKIHLDASMALGGEASPSFELIAERAADLCEIAEKHAPDPGKLIYIIGTEVPVPGGETEEPEALDVTSVSRFKDTISTHRDAFTARGLHTAWDRIVSVVTQPGVDFGHSRVYPFDAGAAQTLCQSILTEPGMTFEAHSTDYQPTKALQQLVAGHFFFLKVGPELTFRFREAVYALSHVEDAIAPESPSDIRAIIERRMNEKDGYWADYYSGTPNEVEFQKIYSYSDRIRYYWGDPQIAEALQLMLENLSHADLPAPIISQYFGAFEFGSAPCNPVEMINAHVSKCIDRYFAAASPK
ncbi:class II D-tagatose-bisphosphate aldolase, non-catalytic subunit [Paracoccus sp. JM45]|uniref:class II D-tagatose-bisphosphate aldolase, non-catalytic subunit n=1 Tax=Paracoccus sp. JM45 TaxID=2283626 RepID=UPI000E6D4C98|nr:class II D-tagatose-bisphosphate aldolase, non-catalytic subunit [Paracoccus sp. JM45]RJE79612.1 tagatose-bisphosphate aldolase [Paracoccus sp. JM45]